MILKMQDQISKRLLQDVCRTYMVNMLCVCIEVCKWAKLHTFELIRRAYYIDVPKS